MGSRGRVNSISLVRLSSGALAAFSPVALTEDTKAKIASMGGTLQYIVALDFEHHIFISEWAKEYPEARIIGPEGLSEKRTKASKSDPKIGAEPFFVEFTPANKRMQKISADFDADFEYEYVDAHPNKELVFFYKPDRVLIEADLLFNLPAIEQYSRVPEPDRESSFLGRLFTSFQTTDGEAKGNKRFLWYALSARDRAGWNESVRRIEAWDWDTLIPCHGETLVGNGKEVFKKIFEWHLEGPSHK